MAHIVTWSVSDGSSYLISHVFILIGAFSLGDDTTSVTIDMAMSGTYRVSMRLSMCDQRLSDCDCLRYRRILDSQ